MHDSDYDNSLIVKLVVDTEGKAAHGCTPCGSMQFRVGKRKFGDTRKSAKRRLKKLTA